MTYTLIQLEVIKVFGRKELSKGLIILKERISEIIAIDYEREGFYRMIDDGENTFSGSIKGAEILGHIPHLEDVVIKLKESLYDFKFNMDEGTIIYISISDGEKTKYILYDMTLPLLEQPESVLIELLTIFK